MSTTVIKNDYQGFVSFINESVVEDSQALISPDTHKLGDGHNPIREKSGEAMEKHLKVHCVTFNY